jgi:membrane associated rhomboid family serine protease
MFLPVRTDAPIRSTPWMNYALIAANVIAFLAQQKVLVGPREDDFNLIPDALTLGSFFTYQFLHADIMHLVGNMLFLYIFGNNVNDRMGHVGYLAFYLAGGVMAALGHLWVSDSPVIGASGSVSAVTGAFLVLFPYSRTTIVYFFYLIGAFEISSLYLILFYFLKDLLLNFVGSTGVAHMAHAAGTVFGFAVTLSLLVVGLLERDHFDVFGLLDRWNRRRQFRAQVATGWTPFGHTGRGTPPPPPARGGRATIEPVPPQMQRVMDLRAAIFEAMNEQRLADAGRLYTELKAIDPSQVLPLRNQLDLATYLAHEQRHAQAAEAYESLLRQYPAVPDASQVQLMLGLIYARYLQQYDRAATHLRAAIERLQSGSGADLAREELSRIEPLLARG